MGQANTRSLLSRQTWLWYIATSWWDLVVNLCLKSQIQSLKLKFKRRGFVPAGRARQSPTCLHPSICSSWSFPDVSPKRTLADGVEASRLWSALHRMLWSCSGCVNLFQGTLMRPQGISNQNSATSQHTCFSFVATRNITVFFFKARGDFYQNRSLKWKPRPHNFSKQ